MAWVRKCFGDSVAKRYAELFRSVRGTYRMEKLNLPKDNTIFSG